MSRKDVHFLFHIIITLHGTKNVMKSFEKILLFNCFSFYVIQQNTMTAVLGHFYQASMERFKHADTYIAIICRNCQKYSIFDPHARNSHGDIDGNGSASLFNFENFVALTNYLTRLAAGKN